MPNGREHKKYTDYGPHKYADHDGTSDCEFGCGCWAGPARSDGPTGLDPFGRCPNNPVDGKRQPGKNDYEDCVNGRIAKLEKKLYEANEAVETVQVAKGSSKVSLIKRLKEAERKVSLLAKTLTKMKEGQAHIQATIETAVSIVSGK